MLFPEIQFEYREYCTKNGIELGEGIDRVWRNAKCDVLGLWSHLWNGGGVFVTRDKNFLNKKEALKRIDPTVLEVEKLEILTPEEACQRLRY